MPEPAAPAAAQPTSQTGLSGGEASAVEEEPEQTAPEEMPEWLRRLNADPAAPAQTAESVPEADESVLPAWLVKLRESAAAEPSNGKNAADSVISPDSPIYSSENEAEGQEMPEPSEEEMPDWTKPLASGAGDAEPTSAWSQAAADETGGEDIPDWLRKIVGPGTESGSADMVEVAEEGNPLPPADTPPPASAMAEPKDEPSSPAPMVQAPVADDSEKGLNAPASVEPHSRAAEEGSSEPAQPAETLPSPSAEMPEWAREVGASDAEAGKAATGPLPPDDAELPDWLVAPLPGAVEGAAPAQPGDMPHEVSTAGEMPQWMSELRPVQEPAADREAALDQVTETTGPLAGVRGVLPVALAVTEPQSLSVPLPTQSSGARVFEEVLAAEEEPAVPAARKPLPSQRWLYLLILLAALVPMLLPAGWAGLGVGGFKTPTVAFYERLSQLEPNSTVLVAFDYEPGQSLELDPGAAAIVGELTRRRVNIIALSTTLTGARIAQNVLVRAARENAAFQPGRNFVNVGYVRGDEKGRRDLVDRWLPANQVDFEGRRLDQAPLMAKVRGFQDLALVIEIAGSDEALRLWMEQAQPNVAVPFVAAISAGVETSARNNLSAGQLAAVLRGLAGAAELEWLLKEARLAIRTVDAQSVVQLFMVVVIVAGNVSLLLQSLKNRKLHGRSV